MKFLIFNIAIVGALYYLFTTDVNGARDMTNMANQAVGRIETLASSAVIEARKFASKRTSLKKAAPPVLEPTPSASRIVASPVAVNPPPPPEPVETVADKAGSDGTTEVVPPKSPGERRRELLDMAQNMELFYLRKAGE